MTWEQMEGRAVREYAFDINRLTDLCRDNAVASVAVFGSVARGEDTPESDIDLLVEFKDRRPARSGAAGTSVVRSPRSQGRSVD